MYGSALSVRPRADHNGYPSTDVFTGCDRTVRKGEGLLIQFFQSIGLPDCLNQLIKDNFIFVPGWVDWRPGSLRQKYERVLEHAGYCAFEKIPTSA